MFGCVRCPSVWSKRAKENGRATSRIMIYIVLFMFYVCSGFKKRAPRAIREIKREAEKEMKTKDVRVDTELNKFVWSKGIRNVPRRVRIKMVRQRNDDEEASEKMFTIVKHVDVDTFKGVVPGKTNVAVDEEDSD